MEKLSQKLSAEYLSNIDSYSEEKTQLLVESLKGGDIPLTEDGVVRILEVGAGGGGSVERFKNVIESEGLENVELHVVDILETPLQGNSVSENADLRVAAKLQQLPYAEAIIRLTHPTL